MYPSREPKRGLERLGTVPDPVLRNDSVLPLVFGLVRLVRSIFAGD